MSVGHSVIKRSFPHRRGCVRGENKLGRLSLASRATRRLGVNSPKILIK